MARQKHSCSILSVNKENVITLWMCLAILSHSDISVFHTFFFFVFFSWGSGYRYREILISNLYCIFLLWQERRASFHAMYLTWHHQVFNKKRRYQVYWITNNFPQGRSKSKDSETKWIKSLGAINSKGLNRITTIGLGQLCLRGTLVLIIIISFRNCRF